MADNEVLHAEHRLEYPYSRSTGPVIGAFLTALRDGRFVGATGTDGRVVVPPTEYDPLTGDAGNDTLYGDAGNDSVDGGTGNDSLYAGAGNDVIIAGLGNVQAFGNGGNDLLIGGEVSSISLGAGAAIPAG